MNYSVFEYELCLSSQNFSLATPEVNLHTTHHPIILFVLLRSYPPSMDRSIKQLYDQLFLLSYSLYIPLNSKFYLVQYPHRYSLFLIQKL